MKIGESITADFKLSFFHSWDSILQVPEDLGYFVEDLRQVVTDEKGPLLSDDEDDMKHVMTFFSNLNWRWSLERADSTILFSMLVLKRCCENFYKFFGHEKNQSTFKAIIISCLFSWIARAYARPVATVQSQH